jgi:hypothetical protein
VGKGREKGREGMVQEAEKEKGREEEELLVVEKEKIYN